MPAQMIQAVANYQGTDMGGWNSRQYGTIQSLVREGRGVVGWTTAELLE